MLGYKFILLITWISTVHAKIRLKRQVLPSTHVQVHSLNSSVSATKFYTVLSGQSRIDLAEKVFNASIWSSQSTLIFDSFDTFVNYTATDVKDLYNMQTAVLHSEADSVQFSMFTNRSTDGHSEIRKTLDGNVNIAIKDEDMGVQAANGTKAYFSGITWHKEVEKVIQVLSEMSKDSLKRELMIIAVSKLYDIKVILDEARVQLEYGASLIDVDPSYRHLVIYTPTRNITLDTVTSPFKVSLTEKQMSIECAEESTQVTMNRNSSDIVIQVGQYSQLEIDRGGGQFHVGSESDESVIERVNVTSMLLQMQLLNDLVTSTSNKSHIYMMGNTTRVGLTALLHQLAVAGGIPMMWLRTGNLSVHIATTGERTVLPTLLPPFQPPEDVFQSIGPVEGKEEEGGSAGSGVTFPFPTLNPSGNNEDDLHSRGSIAPVESGQGEAHTLGATTREVVTLPTDIVTHSPIDILTTENPATVASLSTQEHEEKPYPSLYTLPQSEESTTDNDVEMTSPESQSETTSGGAVVGQFGLTDFGSSQSAHPKGLESLTLFATISNVDMYTETPTFTVAQGQSPFPTPLALRGRRKRRSINDALVMRLFVPFSVNIADPLFHQSISEDLQGAVSESLEGIERSKREATPAPEAIDVEVSGISRDQEAISVQFVVLDDYDRDHAEIAKAMKALGLERLSSKMHYPVAEVRHIKLESYLLLIGPLVCAVLLCTGIVGFCFWKKKYLVKCSSATRNPHQVVTQGGVYEVERPNTRTDMR